MPRWLTSARRHPGILTVSSIYVLGLALVLLWPHHPDAGAGAVYAWILRRVPGLRPWCIDVALNVALFVPIGAILTLALRRRPLRVVGLAWAASLLVEIVQGTLLPGRTSSAVDVAANTIGAALGAVAVGLTRPRGARAPARSEPDASSRPRPHRDDAAVSDSDGFRAGEVAER